MNLRTLANLRTSGAGLPLAAGGGRLISSILFGVSPSDALTLTFAILTLSLLGLSAAFIPAGEPRG